MLGGAIKTHEKNSVWVRHTEEVVCATNGAIPIPEDHLTGLLYDGTHGPQITFSAQHPLRLINLTTGKRTQVTTGAYPASTTGDGAKAIKFINELMDIASTGLNTKAGDHIRLFWEEEVKSSSDKSSAVEVTISPSTFPGTLTHTMEPLDEKHQNIQ